MNILYLIVPSFILLTFLLFLLYKKWSTKAPEPEFKPKPCEPKTSELKSLGDGYMTTKDGKCEPTKCVSGFVKNLEGQCVVMRKFNWII